MTCQRRGNGSPQFAAVISRRPLHLLGLCWPYPYYGEMEMRRHAAPSNAWWRPGGGGTAVILRAYWLLSGYGLRPTRAFTALGIVLLVGAAALPW